MSRLPVALAGALLLAAPPALAQPTEPASEQPGIETSSPTGTPAAAQEPVKPAAPGAAAPATEEEPEPEIETGVSRRRGRTPSAGMSPQDTLVSGEIVGVEPEEEEERTFRFHGFFRGPLRLSIGSRSDPGPSMEKRQFRAPPAVPDSNYTRWSYTNVSPGPWAELLFQFGNNRAMMTTAIASYSLTTGGWRELQAQLGIDRAFLTLNFPEALGDYGTLSWNVGVFSNRYGTAGKYDAGAYETYLFGRTRIGGETLTAAIDVGTESKVLIEHGIGAKLDQQRWTNRAIMPTPPGYDSYEPYPGPQQQGTTLLHHFHIGFDWAGMLVPTLHYLYSWTQDARATLRPLEGGMVERQPDASMRVFGADLRLNGGWMGDGYIGFSSTKAVNAVALSDAIELLHSQGGWQFAANYLGGNGYGTVNSLLFQYSFSLAAFLLRPQAWWGDGADLTLTLFGMYNSISAGDQASEVFVAANGDSRLKFGGNVLYTPLPWFSVGGRVDIVQPNMDNAQRSFQVYSPRLVFRTAFVTHEQVVIQYSHYSYGRSVELPFPYGGAGAPYPLEKPDSGVFSLWAQMWW